MKTKILSLFLAVVMLFSVLTVGATAESLTEVPEGYVGIYTKDDLFNVHLNTSGNYILMNDIIFDESDFDEDYNDGNGWIPIEDFSGTFDGNGYKISNIRISGNISNAGFFRSLTTNATVKNLYIENININVTGSNVGGMTGTIKVDGSRTDSYIISNCKVSGNIKGSSSVAGFCGYFYIPVSGSDRSIALIEKSCNAANVSGSSGVGGIIGYQYSSAYSYGYYGGKNGYCQISCCTNTGTINGKTSIGGIIGYAYESTVSGTYGKGLGYLSVYDCYNYGNINASSLSGGIIGNAIEKEPNALPSQIKVLRCYNAGNIISTSNENVGAITGTSVGSATSVYYINSTVSNPTNTIGTPVTSDQLKIKNMGSNWTFDGCEKYEYPELIDVEPIFQLSGTATVSGEATYGSVLEVTTNDIYPEFADIYVQWIVDGAVAGTESTYTITENDIEKTIYAKIYSDDCVVGYILSNSLLVTKAEQTNSPVPVTVSDRTDTSLSVDVTDGQEYSIDNKNWNTNGVFTSLEANTEHTVYTRIAETDTHFASASDDSCKVTTFKEIINVDSATESEDDKQIVYDNIDNFKTEIFDVITGESEGSSLVRIPVPEDFNADSIEVYVFSDGVLTEIEFTVNDGFICFETTASGKFAVVDKSQIVETEPEEDTTESEEDDEHKCLCACHSENSFISFFQRIIRFLRSLFGLDFCRQCKCDYV